MMEIQDRYHGLPFAERWLHSIQNDATKSLQKLIRAGVVSYYPILDELGKGIVTQSEHTISVELFEPLFAAELSKRLIEKSGQIQNQLKTNRVRQKRLFIEERLKSVSGEMKKMEKELRNFREYNRNLSSSPSLEMRVQEMGREIDLQSSLYITLKTQYEKVNVKEEEVRIFFGVGEMTLL